MYNKVHGFYRVRIEHAFSYLKRFAILSGRYRGRVEPFMREGEPHSITPIHRALHIICHLNVFHSDLAPGFRDERAVPAYIHRLVPIQPANRPDFRVPSGVFAPYTGLERPTTCARCRNSHGFKLSCYSCYRVYHPCCDRRLRKIPTSVDEWECPSCERAR